MQLSSGTVAVENGNALVVASEAADWTDALPQLRLGSPIYFSLQGAQEIPWQVFAIESPNTSGSGFWELTLAAPWAGDTNATASYLIHISFTPNLQLPLISANDRQIPQLLSRAF